ncbi:MAG: universal stress protein [Alphaproteobacteria bacterium]
MLTKTIVVHLEHTELGRERVATAVELAGRQGAHLTGLFLSLEEFDGDLYGRARGRELRGARHDRLAEESLQARMHFEEACKAAGLASFRFASEIGDDEKDLEIHARAADLLVVSDVQERTMEDRFVRGLPETLALTSGLPVLVLPQEFRGSFDPQNVALAWKSSREAVRAVRDNISLLRDAAKVTVISIGTSEETGRLPADQVMHFLERHGINAELRKDYGDNQPGKVILSVADEIGADALVMGANGHPSWRNLMLGNTTRYVIRHHRMPLLLSN